MPARFEAIDKKTLLVYEIEKYFPTYKEEFDENREYRRSMIKMK